MTTTETKPDPPVAIEVLYLGWAVDLIKRVSPAGKRWLLSWLRDNLE